MSSIAEQLDAKLKALDAKAASSLEKMVRDVLELVEPKTARSGPTVCLPIFFARIAREFGNEPFERPPQGELEKREAYRKHVVDKHR